MLVIVRLRVAHLVKLRLKEYNHHIINKIYKYLQKNTLSSNIFYYSYLVKLQTHLKINKILIYLICYAKKMDIYYLENLNNYTILAEINNYTIIV